MNQQSSQRLLINPWEVNPEAVREMKDDISELKRDISTLRNFLTLLGHNVPLYLGSVKLKDD